MRLPPSQISPQELLAHADWVRSLARRLVRDAGSADDLVQETWITALRKPPSQTHNLRAWLARVLRNHAKQTQRGDKRRELREQAGAQDERLPSTEQVVRKAAMQREIVQHVLSLHEPLREVVLLRFFEELSPNQIAGHLGMPVKTVHSRLQRAMQGLRERLDKDYGRTESWCLAIAPLCLAPSGSRLAPGPVALPTSPSLLASILMKTNLKTLLALPVLLLLSWFGWSAWSQSQATETLPSQSAALQTVSQPDDAALTKVQDVQGPDRKVLPASQPSEEPADLDAQADPGWPVHGKVVDPSGLPIEGVTLLSDQTGQTPLTLTDAQGQFELVLPSQTGLDSTMACFRVQAGGWVTLREYCVAPELGNPSGLIVAAPAIELRGSVVDTNGAPIAGAQVQRPQFNWALHGFPLNLDQTQQVAFHTSTNAQGVFEFQSFPKAKGQFLQASAPGFVGATSALQIGSNSIQFVLTKVGEEPGQYITGFVRTQDGLPVADAEIRLASRRVQSDSAGLFRMRIDGLSQGHPLCASDGMHLPALVPFDELQERSQEGKHAIEIILGDLPLTIHGQVLDPDGKGLVGWLVSLQDETPLSRFQIPVEAAEALVRNSGREVTTDARGRFTLEGLYPREYQVLGYDPHTLQRVQGATMPGTTELLLRPQFEWIEDLSGLLTDRHGLPIEGATLKLQTATYRTSYGYTSASAGQTTSDASGRFSLGRVPAQGCQIHVNGTGLIPKSHPLEPGTQHDLVATRRHSFVIELGAAWSTIDQVEFQDDAQNALQVSFYSKNGMSGFPRAAIVDGHSQPLSVSEVATTMVFFENGKERARHPVQLMVDEVTVLRF